MYKLIRTTRNKKTGRAFIKQIKMIDKVERMGDTLKIHFDCGGWTNRTKERLDKHCGIVGIMTQREIKQYKDEQRKIEKTKENLMAKLLYAGVL